MVLSARSAKTHATYWGPWWLSIRRRLECPHCLLCHLPLARAAWNVCSSVHAPQRVTWRCVTHVVQRCVEFTLGTFAGLDACSRNWMHAASSPSCSLSKSVAALCSFDHSHLDCKSRQLGGKSVNQSVSECGYESVWVHKITYVTI